MPILAFNIEVGILPGLNPGILAVNAISDNFSLILSSISFAEITILNSRLSPFEFFFCYFHFYYSFFGYFIFCQTWELHSKSIHPLTFRLSPSTSIFELNVLLSVGLQIFPFLNFPGEIFFIPHTIGLFKCS